MTASVSSSNISPLSFQPSPTLSISKASIPGPPPAPPSCLLSVHFNTSGEDQAIKDKDSKGCRSSSRLLRFCTDQLCGINRYIFQHEPDARECSTAVEDLLWDTIA
ncbi:hypothetical protein GOODEAATRI_029508 [Goodea atripinnis]|uniref:Uncharacterized protein n=1 Tax=Goodea atripinnis TaxID=208336 RepID=A0ABV0MW82_9TELE